MSDNIVVEQVAICLQTNTPFHWVEVPGVGKTVITQLLSSGLGLKSWCFVLSHYEPTVFGWPAPDLADNALRFLPHRKFVEIARDAKDNQWWTIFADELSTCTAAQQRPGLKLFHERNLADFQLPMETRIAAASNPPEVATGGRAISPPMANRVLWIYGPPSREAWYDGMLTGFRPPQFKRVPNDWREHLPHTRALVVAALRKFPQFLDREGFPNDESKQCGPYPSRRSWSDLFVPTYTAASLLGDKDLTYTLACGAVGEAAAGTVLHWINEQDIPDIPELVRNPKKFKMPKSDDRLYVILSCVVAECARECPEGEKLNKEQTSIWLNCWSLLDTCAPTKANIVHPFVDKLGKFLHASRPVPDTQSRELVKMLTRFREAK